MADRIDRLLAPIRTRIANLVARAIVRVVYESTGIQGLQLDVLEGETRDACERFQNYGFTSVPSPGAEAVVLFVGGRRDHALVLAVEDRRYRLKGLAQGEVAIYSDEGDSIRLGRGRVVTVTAGTKVHIAAPTVEASGNVTATGSVNAEGSLKVAGTQVVGSRAGAIAPPAGGSTVDGPARTTIGQIIATLQAHGLIS